MNQFAFTPVKTKSPYDVSSIVYVIVMSVAFTERFGNIRLGYKLQLIIGLFWICIALLKLSINNFRYKGIYKKDFPLFIKIYLLPHVIIHLYTIILMCLGKVNWEYFTTNMTVYIPTLLAVFSIYLFGLKSFKYNCIALIISWTFSVVYSVITVGFRIFPDAILQGYFGVPVVNYLEFHDLVLATGYIIIFYMCSRNKIVKRDFLVFFSVIVVMLLGIKRISVFAVILILIFWWVLRLYKIRTRYKLCIITGVIFFFICYAYIFLIYSGDSIYEFLEHYRINMSGRRYYYSAIMDLIEFKPTFMGLGRNSVARILVDDFSYLHVGGVHSDIIKMYAENGFILFGLWLWYYLIFLTKTYKKHYGYTSAVLYFLITIYSFILYLTDNIEIYFICQIFSIIIPASYGLKCKKEILIEK